MHDSLTDLYNRTYFEKEFKALQNSSCDAIGLFICDLDGLKTINDNIGHDKGDELIKKAANVLRSSVCEKHKVCRIGGDEFAIIVTDCTKKELKKIKHKINTLEKEHNHKNTQLKLSISTGFSIMKNIEKDIEQIYKEADRNMYKEKSMKKQLQYDSKSLSY